MTNQPIPFWLALGEWVQAIVMLMAVVYLCPLTRYVLARDEDPGVRAYTTLAILLVTLVMGVVILSTFLPPL